MYNRVLVSAGKARSASACWTSSHGTSSMLVRYLRACLTASILRSLLISSTNSCWRRWNSRVDLIFLSLLLWSWIQANAAWVWCWARVSSTFRATRNMSRLVSSASSGFCLTTFWANSEMGSWVSSKTLGYRNVTTSVVVSGSEQMIDQKSFNTCFLPKRVGDRRILGRRIASCTSLQVFNSSLAVLCSLEFVGDRLVNLVKNLGRTPYFSNSFLVVTFLFMVWSFSTVTPIRLQIWSTWSGVLKKLFSSSLIELWTWDTSRSIVFCPARNFLLSTS